MAGQSVQCCFCGEGFPERELGGAWLDRRCPHCSERLSEQAYDEAAARLLDGVKRPLPKNVRVKLKKLALSRYYMSEWFRLACEGQGSTAADRGLFGMRAFYQVPDARFCLEPVDQDRAPEAGWGVGAEYRVFDALRAEIVSENSPLAGARLLPNLLFPWIVKPQQWGAHHRAQVDCLLLTRSCAVVVEVKRREHRIKVSKGFGAVREATSDGEFKSAKETLDQIAEEVAAVAERVDLYPEERIFKLLVYVDSLGFEGAGRRFVDGVFVGHLDDADRRSDFIQALRSLVGSLKPCVSQAAVVEQAEQLQAQFGNVRERREGRIVASQGDDGGKRLHRTEAMLDALERRANDADSPLYGAKLIRGLVFEVPLGRRSGEQRRKKVRLPGLLLTRTHAVLIDTKRWPVHVNTHSPFATVYTGDPKDGAKHVEEDIRHDWDLEAIHYQNRSASLSMLEVIARSMTEVDRYRRRNRVCTLNVFLDPKSFFTDRDGFRSRTYCGYWRGRDENILAPLERLVGEATPIMTQEQLEAFADTLIR